jgi:NRAMP (natural resistance-associated macrophage protein)-like metal ion transporter
MKTTGPRGRNADTSGVTALGVEAYERRNVLDRAHRGDIEGALGRVQVHAPRPGRSGRRRLIAFLAVMGPGLLVMVADNDAGSVSTFAQAGQSYGLDWLWLVGALAVALFLMQEMASRLGAVTGAGHARLIYERFGRRWGMFALGDLVVLNVLTLVTELIGVQFGLGYFGVSRFVSVPLVAAGIVALTATGSFRAWERLMYGLVAGSLVVVPFSVLVHLHASGPALVPHHHMMSHQGLLFAVALVGTTLAPWQLFFHQSNVVDKRITAPWIAYERADTAIGAGIFALGAVAMITGCAVVFGGAPFHGSFSDAATIAEAVRRRTGAWAGGLFAVALVDGSILGAAAVTLSTAYAVGDVTGVRHSLHRRWKEAPSFYGAYAGSVVGAAAAVLLIGRYLGVITLTVQALTGILFPSAAIFLLLMCNDADLLGPWVNRRIVNLVMVAVVTAVVVVAALLTLTTAFPHVDLRWATAAVVLAVIPLVVALRPWSSTTTPASRNDRPRWTMPPLDRLPRPARSRARNVGLLTLRAYLTLAVVVLVVKVVLAVSSA